MRPASAKPRLPIAAWVIFAHKKTAKAAKGSAAFCWFIGARGLWPVLGASVAGTTCTSLSGLAVFWTTASGQTVFLGFVVMMARV